MDKNGNYIRLTDGFTSLKVKSANEWESFETTIDFNCAEF